MHSATLEIIKHPIPPVTTMEEVQPQDLGDLAATEWTMMPKYSVPQPKLGPTYVINRTAILSSAANRLKKRIRVLQSINKNL